MANMRIIYDNKVDSASTLVASNTAVGSSTTNLQNEYKGSAHRSTGTSVSYTVSWTSAVPIGGIVLPATNLTGSSTIRVRLYDDIDATGVLLFDSTAVDACPGSNLELWNWGMPLNANSFIFGGASKTSVWLADQVSAKSMLIDLVDTTNPVGYIDCSKIIAGPYWEPKYNVSNGVTVSFDDSSEVARTESGDLVADRGYHYDKLQFDFSYIDETDKNAIIQLIRRVGTSRNILVSIFPNSGNSLLEQTNTIYGKRANSDISLELYGLYRHSMALEGW